MDGSIRVEALENGRVKLTVSPSGAWFDIAPDIADEVADELVEMAHVARQVGTDDGGR